MSAYSQGFALSLYVRLYRVTGDQAYLDSAQAVFRSFRQLGPGSRPWVSYVVSGELWLEQYPRAARRTSSTASISRSSACTTTSD